MLKFHLITEEGPGSSRWFGVVMEPFAGGGKGALEALARVLGVEGLLLGWIRACSGSAWELGRRAGGSPGFLGSQMLIGNSRPWWDFLKQPPGQET